MSQKFEILANYIKDMSVETPNIETYIFVKENISKYHLNIDITSKPLKNRMIEVSTILKFEDKEQNEKKSYFEIIYVSIIKIKDEVREKKEIEKIVICELQNLIYPKIEKIFLNTVNYAGFEGLKIEKKIDFNKLYDEKYS